MVSNTGHLSALTGVRGFAALWVMFFHFAGSAGVSSSLNMGSFINMGAWGVEIFFVLSGFVLSYVYFPVFTQSEKSTSFGAYLLLRLARVYPLHIAVLAIYLVLFLLTQYLGMTINNSQNFGWADGVRHVLLIQAWGEGNPVSWNPVAWSISAEWFAYILVFPLTLMIGRYESAKSYLLVCMVAWVFFYIFYATGPAWKYLHLYEHALLRVTVDFSLGAALYHLWRVRPVGGIHADNLWMIGAAGIVALTFLPPYFSVLLLPCIAMMIFGLAAEGRLASRTFSNPVSMYLGDISYSIYMIHPLVLVAGNLCYKLAGGPQGIWFGILFFIGQCFVALILSVITYYLIEDPMRRWVRKKLRRQKVETNKDERPAAALQR